MTEEGAQSCNGEELDAPWPALKMEEGGRQPRNAAASRSWNSPQFTARKKRGASYDKELNSACDPKEQEPDSPLETPERNAACRHLDFSLLTYEL